MYLYFNIYRHLSTSLAPKPRSNTIDTSEQMRAKLHDINSHANDLINLQRTQRTYIDGPSTSQSIKDPIPSTSQGIFIPTPSFCCSTTQDQDQPNPSQPHPSCYDAPLQGPKHHNISLIDTSTRRLPTLPRTPRTLRGMATQSR